jgi:hypothetical protein
MSGLFPCSCHTVNTRRLVSTLHGGDAGYSQSFFSRVERSAASGGRVVRVEASGIVLNRKWSGEQ